MTVGVISETAARFAADPAAAMTTPGVTATLANGRARLSAGPFNWEADLPLAIGGQNLAPSAIARGSADLRGLLGAGDASPEIGDLELEIRVTSPDRPEQTEPMLAAWRERCPIYLALLKPNALALQASVTSSS